jgi:hypothetical protein
MVSVSSEHTTIAMDRRGSWCAVVAFLGAVFLSKFLFVGVGFSSGFFGTVFWFFLCGVG